MSGLEHTQNLPRRILFNASNVRIGGGVQAAIATIREALTERLCDNWHFALSKELFELLEDERSSLAGRADLIEPGPARSRSGRRQVLALASSLSPEAVFTFVGPTHVKFPQPHLMGLNNTWLIGDLRDALSYIPSLRAKAYMAAWVLYTRKLAGHADKWVTQTGASRDGIADLLNVPLDRIRVVSNTPSERYRVPETLRKQNPASDSMIKILCFASPHPHKRFSFCADVAASLKELDPKLKFKFVVTIPPESPEWQRLQARAENLGVFALFENRGFVRPDDGPDLYRECSLLFLPTVLEVFSATYPEAMAMNVPIVTCDLDFARSVCGNAAMYFDPHEPLKAAESILHILRDPAIRATLISNGHQTLAQLPTQRERLHLYLEAIEDLIAGTRSCESSR